MGVPNHIVAVTHTLFTAAGIKLSIQKYNGIRWSVQVQHCAVTLNAPLWGVVCLLVASREERNLISSGARLPQTLIKVTGGADRRPGVCIDVCKCVCAWTCRGSSFNIHNCCHAYISPWLTAGVHWHHGLAPETWKEKSFPRIPLPNAMRCLLLKFDRAPTSAWRRCRVQVFSHQAQGFNSRRFIDSGGNGHGCIMVAIQTRLEKNNRCLQLWMFLDWILATFSVLFTLYHRCEVVVWCGAHNSVASRHSWRRFGALVTLPNTNPCRPAGLLTITAVLTLNQTLQLSHSSRLIICSLGSRRRTSVSQVSNWIMWGFGVYKEAGCCCNSVCFRQDDKVKLSLYLLCFLFYTCNNDWNYFGKETVVISGNQPVVTMPLRLMTRSSARDWPCQTEL